MINEKQVKRYCYEPEKIENYDKAVADTEHMWHCHHRGEILPCGTYSPSDLKKFGLYWNRPASELIFLTQGEHSRLHKTGRKHSEEEKKKISKALKGRKISEEWRRKMSEAQKGEKSHWFGKKHSEETKKKIAEASRRYWANRRAGK